MPKRPNPARITLACGSSIVSEVDSSLLLTLLAIIFSCSKNSTGAKNIEIATAEISGSITSMGSTPFIFENWNNTNANSPPWASAMANNDRWELGIEKIRPTHSSTSHFTAIRPNANPAINPMLSPIRVKLRLAPIEIKKIPSSRPLKGSMSLSSSWRNSLSASITPAKNAPRAGDKPTVIINSEVPITKARAAATNTSRTPVAAMILKMGSQANLPSTNTTPIASMVKDTRK